MSLDTILTCALRNNLQSLQSTQKGVPIKAPEYPSCTNEGAQSAINQAAQDLCTQCLSAHSSALDTMLDGLSFSITTLEQTGQALKTAITLIQKSESIVLEAQNGKDNQNEALSSVMAELDALITHAQTSGNPLLCGDDLVTTFGTAPRDTLITQGFNMSLEELAFDTLSLSSKDTIEAALNSIQDVLEDAQSMDMDIQEDLALIQTRQDFTQGTLDILEAGQDDFSGFSSLNEEGANLLALQTRQALKETSLSQSLASPAQKDVLQLF